MVEVLSPVTSISAGLVLTDDEIQIKSVFQAIGRCIMAVVNAIGAIIMAIVNGIVTLFDIIIGYVFLPPFLL